MWVTTSKFHPKIQGRYSNIRNTLALTHLYPFTVLKYDLTVTQEYFFLNAYNIFNLVFSSFMREHAISTLVKSIVRLLTNKTSYPMLLRRNVATVFIMMGTQ